jgi:hypothetical protein
MASIEHGELTGRAYLRTYQVPAHKTGGGEQSGMSSSRRAFCSNCGTMLWNKHPSWQERIYPFASVIDTTLPTPPEWTHIMLGSKASWVVVPEGTDHRHFKTYPDESIVEWHRRHDLLEE